MPAVPGQGRQFAPAVVGGVAGGQQKGHLGSPQSRPHTLKTGDHLARPAGQAKAFQTAPGEQPFDALGKIGLDPHMTFGGTHEALLLERQIKRLSARLQPHAAARQAAGMDRAMVRASAVRRFGIGAMIDRYEELYHRCIAGCAAPAPEVDFPPIELPARGDVLPLAAE